MAKGGKKTAISGEKSRIEMEREEKTAKTVKKKHNDGKKKRTD